MRLRRAVVAATFVVAVLPAFALDVVLAPVVLQDEAGERSDRGPSRPEADLLRALGVLEGGGKPLVRRVNLVSEPAPRSLLEAARLCEAHAYGQLLYGFVRRTDHAFHAEIKLFDSEAGEIVAVFFGSDDESHYDRLVADVASKIVAWFRDEAGVAPRRAAERERNLVSLPCALGAWTPLGGDWGRVTRGLAAIALGGRFVPVRPLFAAGTRSGEIAIGLDLEYALGMNEPGYESFFLHMARFRLTVEASVDFAPRMSLGFGLGPLLAVDTMAQDRLYDRLAVETTTAAGVSLALTCRYAVSERVRLGLANVVDIAAYGEPLVVCSPRLIVDFGLYRSGRGGGGE